MKLSNNQLSDFRKNSGFDFTLDYYYEKIEDNGNHRKVCYPVRNRRLLRHLYEDKIISLPMYKHTKMFVIDIDRRNQKEQSLKGMINIVKTVVKYLGDPFYLEYSTESGGYHLYYVFNQYVSEYAFKYLYKYFKDTYEYEIEFIHHNKTIRLPYSEQYRNYAGTYNSDNRLLISKLKNANKIIYLFVNKQELSVPLPQIINKNNKFGIKLLYDKDQYSMDSDKEARNDVKFKYGCGTRHTHQLKIGLYVLAQGKGYDEFLRLCDRYNDGTSKDMALSERKKSRILGSVWKWCVKKFNSMYHIPIRNTSEFYSPLDEDNFIYYCGNNLSLPFKLEKELKFLYSEFYRYLNIGKKDGKYEKRFIKDALKLYKIIWNKQEYHKSIRASYSQEGYSFLNGSIPFGKKLRQRIAKEFQISNIEKVLDFLIYVMIIKQRESPEGYVYSYKKKRWCSHYEIMDTFQKVYAYLFRLHMMYYDVSKEKIISKNSFIKHNLVNLYILLLNTRLYSSLINNVRNYLYGQNDFFPLIWYFYYVNS